jgi:hypothetical protein
LSEQKNSRGNLPFVEKAIKGKAGPEIAWNEPFGYFFQLKNQNEWLGS